MKDKIKLMIKSEAMKFQNGNSDKDATKRGEVLGVELLNEYGEESKDCLQDILGQLAQDWTVEGRDPDNKHAIACGHLAAGAWAMVKGCPIMGKTIKAESTLPKIQKQKV